MNVRNYDRGVHKAILWACGTVIVICCLFGCVRKQERRLEPEPSTLAATVNPGQLRPVAVHRVDVGGMTCAVVLAPDGVNPVGISCAFPPAPMALCSTDASCEALEYAP